MDCRVGIDTGGTFTDVILAGGDGRMWIGKTPTVPAAPATGLVTGLDKVLGGAGRTRSDVGMVLHGTTLATNAAIEQKGDERLGLVVTRGFRDILEIARQTVPGGFGAVLSWVKPAPIVPLDLVREITERVRASGDIAVPLDEGEVRRVAREYRELGVRHVAVCLLHAYAVSRHEERVAEIFADEHPDCRLSLSSRVYPEFREYERAVLTVLNAYLMAPMSRYLQEAERALDADGVRSPLLIMQSNGGVASATEVARAPIYAVLSGPAAGVIASAHVAALSDLGNLITVDVGGTSTDIGLVVGGRVRMTTEARVGAHPVKLPMVDVTAIGAGGGSVAWIAPGPSLKVGPRSAGADPGPACYGKGGDEATVTDANLLLGRIPPALLGGEIHLDRARAEAAIARVAKAIGLDAIEAAWGITEIATENMCHGIREVTVRRGQDPRDFALLAYGGAGPLHAGRIGELLGIRTIVVPPYPGVHSALGLLVSALRQDRVATSHHVEGAVDLGAVGNVVARLGEDLGESFARQGVASADVTRHVSADLRYVGQGYEVTVDVPDGDITEASVATTIGRFHRAHEALFGYRYENHPVEIVNLRLTGLRPLPSLAFPRIEEGSEDPGRALDAHRMVYLADPVRGFRECPVFARQRLLAGNLLTGPAIIEQPDSTTVVEPGQQARIDAFGNVVITARAPSNGRRSRS